MNPKDTRPVNPMAGFGRRSSDHQTEDRDERRQARAVVLGTFGCLFLAIAVGMLLSAGWGFAFLGIAAVITAVAPSE